MMCGHSILAFYRESEEFGYWSIRAAIANTLAQGSIESSPAQYMYNKYPKLVRSHTTSSKHALGTPHLPFLSLEPRTSHPTRPRQRLERTLRPVVIIAPLYHIHMQRHPGRHRPAAQPMMHHLAIQLPNHRPLKVKIANEERAGRNVDDCTGKSFVERRVAVAEAGETGAGTQSGLEGGAEREEGIFTCVVVVDCHEIERKPLAPRSFIIDK